MYKKNKDLKFKGFEERFCGQVTQQDSNMGFRDLCMFLLPYISLRALLPQLTEAHRSQVFPDHRVLLRDNRN